MATATQPAGVYGFVSSLPVFSDHEHHQPNAFFASGMSLDKALNNSYVTWSFLPIDGTRKSREVLLDNARFNSYFHWFERGIQAVYGIEQPLDLDTWDAISVRIHEAHAADPDFHWKTLKKFGYERMLLDAYWNPGDDDNLGELFSPSFRIDMFMNGFYPEAHWPGDFAPWAEHKLERGTLEDYVDLVRDTLHARHAAGKLLALKCGAAYHRNICFLPDDRAVAERVFGLPLDQVDRKDQLLFGNFIFNRCCEMAGEMGVPFQIHTGLGQLSGSQPLKLEPILARYPGTRFVLFHSGFPWTHEVAGLVHNYPNALPSMTWTSIICTSAAVRVLHDFIDVAPSINTITWGGDCWVPEESVGALLAWRYVVSTVIGERLRDHRLKVRTAEILARKLLYGNGRRVYLNE